MYKVGLSTKGKIFDESLFRTYAEGGIFEMEISLPWREYQNIDWQEVKRRSDTYGVHTWSVHLPFGSPDELSVSSLDPAVRKFTLAYHDAIIQGASAIGVDKFVLHASAEPIADEIRQASIEAAKESLRHLASTAQNCGARIAVEELPRTCLGNTRAEMHDLLSADERLRMCFDTNHLANDDPAGFIREFGDKIITIHVSDGTEEGEKHWLPGEGTNDWQSILAALSDIGFSGIWMYEIEFKAPPNILRPRDLTCADFLKNANEIFYHKPLTVLGKGK